MQNKVNAPWNALKPASFIYSLSCAVGRWHEFKFCSEEEQDSDDERLYFERRTLSDLIQPWIIFRVSLFKFTCISWHMFAFMRKKQYYVTVLHYGRERSEAALKDFQTFTETSKQKAQIHSLKRISFCFNCILILILFSLTNFLDLIHKK